MRGDSGPLRFETLRFLQDSVDNAYARGIELYEKGLLPVRLSKEEAIGNYIDVQVRWLGRGSTYLITRPREPRTRKSSMPINQDRYIPEGIGEVYDYIGSMMFRSPTFVDKTGYLPWRNVETTFHALNEGLKRTRPDLGDELFAKLSGMSNRMRAYFEADPDDATGESVKGRDLILDMMDLLKAHGRNP